MNLLQPSTTARFRIGAFDIEPSRNLICCAEIFYSLEPRIMDVLCTLASRSGEVVTRSELIEAVWGVQFGGDESLSRAISKLRKTFRLCGSEGEIIETIPKRGYRLAERAEGFEAHGQGLDEALSGDLQAVQFTDEITQISYDNAESKRSIKSYSVAVVPMFISGSGIAANLADDIARDLVSMLARAPYLRVAGYDSALLGQNGPPGLLAAGRLLNVHYVVSGSLSYRDKQIILRISLVDAIDGTHILSWKHSGTVDRFFEDLDEFILDLSTPILCEIQIFEASLAHLRPGHYSEGLRLVKSTEMLRTLYSARRAAEIVEHLEHVIDQEPDNAAAHASLAVQFAQTAASFFGPYDENMAKAEKHLALANRIAPTASDVLSSAGIVAAMSCDVETAVQTLHRSLQLNPNDPHCLAVFGWQSCFLTGDRNNIEVIETAERRAPHHPRFSIWAHYRGVCEGKLGDWEAAAAAYALAKERNPHFHSSQFMLGTALAELDQPVEARTEFASLQNSHPQFTLDSYLKWIEHWRHCWPDLPSAERAKAHVTALWPS